MIAEPRDIPLRPSGGDEGLSAAASALTKTGENARFADGERWKRAVRGNVLWMDELKAKTHHPRPDLRTRGRERRGRQDHSAREAAQENDQTCARCRVVEVQMR